MDTNDLANWLLSQQSHIALQWIEEMLAGKRSFPDDFSWQLLAECAASKANLHPRNACSPDLDWAYVAVLAYRHLIEEEQKSTRLIHKPELKKNIYTSYQLKLMQVQADSILAFGPAEGDLVRDVNQLIQSFFEGVSLSPEDLREAYSDKKREYSFKERMELHWLQQKLRVLRPLEKKHLLLANQDLTHWFSVWDQIYKTHEQ